MDYREIEVTDRDEIRVVTLHRPEKLNAWTPVMQRELTHAVVTANGDDSVGAIVVTGAGRAFCAGADVGYFADQLAADEREAPTASPDAEAPADELAADPADADWVALVRRSKPIVGALNGAAVGVGLSMVLPFDFLVAHPDAKLSARFVKMGVVPELASSHFLVQRCGWGAASDLALSGRTLLGDEALQLRLVDEVADDVVDAAVARARSYAENAPASVRFAKELLTRNGTEADLREVQRRELTLLEQAYATDDHREAVSAFLERRPPKFR